MVITMLRATVAEDRVADLERAYREGTAELPPEIPQTFLLRDSAEPHTFVIMTQWASREALEQMRASGVTPRGVQIFRAAGADPRLSIHDVLVHHARVPAAG